MKTQSPKRDQFILESVNPILFVLSLIPFSGAIIYVIPTVYGIILALTKEPFEVDKYLESSMFMPILLALATILLSLLTPFSYALPFPKKPPKAKYWLVGSVVIGIWALICWAIVGGLIYVAFTTSMSLNGLGGGFSIALVGGVVSISSVYTFKRYRYLKTVEN